MAISDQISIPISALRTGEELLGSKDGTNIIFDTPEEFVLDLEGSFYFHLFRNGQLQELGTQFSILESNGRGVGLKIFRPPRSFESLRVDYIAYVT